MRTIRITVFALLATVVLLCDELPGQSFRLAGTEFRAMRPVRVPADKSYSVVVAEFLHHGQINAEGTNLVVATNNREVAPSRILQLGPGDFCRLAIETLPRQSVYNIFYGGDPPTVELPPWTAVDGLLLETRRYENRVAGTLDAVRDAFEGSQPIGAGYVEAVQHSHNPFVLEPGPLLSRYSGKLDLKITGNYGFFVSARDVGFLLIDGKEVAAAQGPKSRATPADRKMVRLLAGRHSFEYYHAAAGAGTLMLVAWEVDPQGEKPAPVLIPSDAFRTRQIGRLPVGHVTLESGRPMADFLVEIRGDVPLPDHSVPLIGVFFEDVSPETLSSRATVRWDFGDGQTGELPKANHIYLRPGVYTVTLSLTRATRTVTITNRVNVGRPILTRRDHAKFHKLDDYLRILDTYDPSRLDAASLSQLVLAYEAKALALEAQAELLEAAAQDPNRRPDADPVVTPQPPDDPMRYIAKAVDVGKAAFLAESAARDSDDLHALARLIAPMARERLGDSKLVARIWYGAAKRIDTAELKAECEVEAADVAINDLLNFPAAKTILDAATARLPDGATGPLAAKLHRVWGDYHSASGDGSAARAAYDKAEQLLGSKRRYIERTAWRGAHSRSTEEFLRQRQFERAASQLRAWQDEFPAAKVNGYLTLLYAQYWAGRALHRPAVAQAEQLRTVNPDSPYVDRILLLAAESEVELGRPDRALALLQSLLHDYPGSPLVPLVKEKIAELQDNQ
ncbi:MAG: PKD domain-containing protein [Thermoguttaceae bacterium]